VPLLAAAGRITAYLVVAAISWLLLATISERRLASYGSVLAVAVLAAVAGAANAIVASRLNRLPQGSGCLLFSIVALTVNACLALAVAAIGAGVGVTMTPWGVAVGAMVLTIGCGIVFTLWDEGYGAE
jgi:hypothetical protein